MPRRLRIDKRRDLLTLDRDLTLVVGPHPGRPKPEPGTDEWEELRVCFEQHRERYSESSWGHLAFEVGDVAAAIRVNPLIPVE